MGNDWTVSVDLILKSGVKMLLFDTVWHDDQEEVNILGLLWFVELSTLSVLATYVGSVVVINSVLECLNARFVAELNNVSIININVETSLL